MVEVDLEAIKKHGYSIVTPVCVIGDSIENKNVTYQNIGESTTQDVLFHVA